MEERTSLRRRMKLYLLDFRNGLTLHLLQAELLSRHMPGYSLNKTRVTFRVPCVIPAAVLQSRKIVKIATPRKLSPKPAWALTLPKLLVLGCACSPFIFINKQETVRIFD